MRSRDVQVQRSEVGGVEPKVSPTGNSSSEFDVFALSRYAYASRDVRDVRGVPCVRRRARDRSITWGADLARNRFEAKAILGGFSFCSCSFCCHARVSRLEDMAMYFLHVFCTRLMEYGQFLEDMERT